MNDIKNSIIYLRLSNQISNSVSKNMNSYLSFHPWDWRWHQHYLQKSNFLIRLSHFKTTHLPQNQTSQRRIAMLTLEIHEDTILSAPWLPLPNNDSREHLLTEIRLTFLDSSHNHITNTSWWQTVKTTLDSFNRNDVKVLSSRVVSTVHSSSHWQTQWHPELVTRGSSSSYKSINWTVSNKNLQIKYFLYH